MQLQEEKSSHTLCADSTTVGIGHFLVCYNVFICLNCVTVRSRHTINVSVHYACVCAHACTATDRGICRVTTMLMRLGHFNE